MKSRGKREKENKEEGGEKNAFVTLSHLHTEISILSFLH